MTAAPGPAPQAPRLRPPASGPPPHGRCAPPGRALANSSTSQTVTTSSDVIESGASLAGTAANIKRHHNVGGLPSELGFRLVEPLRDL
ncbi:MAG: hypothetical protein ACKOTD_13520, partial [Phycisphaerales bacterium]